MVYIQKHDSLDDGDEEGQFGLGAGGQQMAR